MAEISKRYTITYRWWNSDLESISPEHQAALDETAEARIAEMLMEGFTSGELYDNIYMLDTDPEDGIEYQGWWVKKTTETEHVSFPPSKQSL